MKQYFTIDRWVEILRKVGSEEKGGGLLSFVVLSKLSGLENFTLRKALIRAEEKGLLERVGSGLYLNKFARLTLEELAMALGKPCYVSFESALSHYGIISQEPLVLTCATTGKPYRKSTPLGEIAFRHIINKRFCGYIENNGVLRAEPEKALLDLLYWSSKIRGRFPDLDEVSWKELKKKKLFFYAKRFPLNIQKFLKEVTGSHER